MNWRRCAVCANAAQHSIEKKIREGASLELLAEYYGISDEVLRRHRDSHMNTQLPTTAVRPMVTSSRMDAEAMFHEHEEVARECRELIDYARSKQNIQGWSSGVRTLLVVLDQQNRMLGLYQHIDQHERQVHSQRLVEVISRALEKYPEAKDEVLAAIDEVEEDAG